MLAELGDDRAAVFARDQCTHGCPELCNAPRSRSGSGGPARFIDSGLEHDISTNMAHLVEPPAPYRHPRYS